MRRHPWLTVILLIVVLFAALFFANEWRAETRWEQYAAAARARGVKLQLTDFARPEIPDAQNFAALPMLQAAFKGDAKPFQLPDRPGTVGSGLLATKMGNRPEYGALVTGQGIDWKEWQKYFHDLGYLPEPTNDPVRDVLRALDHFAPEMRQWSEWRTRPRCRFPLDLAKGWDLPLPHLAAFQGAAHVFALRLRAHLALGDSAAAYADFREGLQADNALREEPTLISGLVRQSILAVLLAAVGDGLKARAWGDAELQQVPADLAAIRIWDDYRLAIASERGFLNQSIERLLAMPAAERAKTVAAFGGGVPKTSDAFLFRLIPRSAFRDNQLRGNRYLEELAARADVARQTYDPDGPTPSAPGNLSGGSGELYYFLISLSGPVYENVARHYVSTQTHLDEARLACALERFRRAHGIYPAALAELTPEFMEHLPLDPYARAPYHYQRTAAGSFQLYSVGAEHNATPATPPPSAKPMTSSSKRLLDPLWLYAPPAAP